MLRRVARLAERAPESRDAVAAGGSWKRGGLGRAHLGGEGPLNCRLGRALMSCWAGFDPHPAPTPLNNTVSISETRLPFTDVKGKIYIGSTNNYNKRWKQHEEAGEDMPLHRAIKDQGIENFSFEVIKTVEYIDNEQLLIIESCYMDKYDSITNGYNTKHSVDMFNLY